MIILDIETTGLDPRKHSLLSIGAVNFANPEETFYGECRMFDGAEVMEEVLEMNGFSVDSVIDKKKQSPSELINQFVEWLNQFKDQTIAGHNVNSDLGFLRIEAARSNLKYRFSYRIVDLHTVAYVKRLTDKDIEPLTKDITGLEIDDIVKLVGIDGDRVAFQALEDARLEAECFSRLIYGKELFDEYKEYEVPSYLK
jgi:DNA polymerase III epsilon subunit-like protein